MIRKTLLIIGLVTIGFVIGAVTAYIYYEQSFDASKWIGAVGTDFLAGQYAFNQYSEADYPTASKALEDYLYYLEHLSPYRKPWEPGQSPWLGPEGLLFDRMLSWSRLASLHERNGNSVAAEQAWEKATNYAIQLHWKNTTKEYLRRVIARFDQKSGPAVSQEKNSQSPPAEHH